MKAIKRLYIGDKEVQLVSDDVLLDESSPGKAQFVIVDNDIDKNDDTAGETPEGVVTLYFGYAGHETYQYFIGYIEQAIRQSSSSWHITCRELSNILQMDCPISLIHCSLKDVIQELHKTTNLNFIVAEQTYSNKKVPRFYNTGSGFDACRNIASIFEIDDFIWQQQGDGSIYIGSWSHSYWFDKPLEIDERFYSKAWGKGAVLPSVPALRPGCELNGRRIQKLRNTKNQVTVTYA